MTTTRMTTFKQFLLEKAPPSFSAPASVLVKLILAKLPLEEISSYRGKYFNDSGSYQLRFKPTAGTPVSMQELLDFLKSPEAKKDGISKVQEISTSKNSGKYKAIPFSYLGQSFEAIIGSGQNQGEKFEKEVLTAMQDYLKGDYNELAHSAFTAIDDLDLDNFSPDEIKTAKARSGSTSRANVTPEEMGKILADIVLVMDSGDEIYLSVKNELGDTVGQLGLVDTFKADFTINTKTPQFKDLVKPLNLNIKKITDGFHAYENGEALDSQIVKVKGTDSPDLITLMKKFFGVGYIYLRQKGDGFSATEINDEFLDDKLLDGLKMTEIRYPEAGRKQISVFLNSNSTKFKIEIRNAKGGIVPAQIQLKILSTTLDEMNK